MDLPGAVSGSNPLPNENLVSGGRNLSENPRNSNEYLVSSDIGESSSLRARPSLVSDHRSGMQSERERERERSLQGERDRLIPPQGAGERERERERPGGSSARQGGSSARETVAEKLIFRANFIGTDYNFANSAALREVFAKNFVADETAIEAATTAANAVANGGAAPNLTAANSANPGKR
jgi:hypothetical protein